MVIDSIVFGSITRQNIMAGKVVVEQSCSCHSSWEGERERERVRERERERERERGKGRVQISPPSACPQ
jgi:hypothetical protein